MSKRFTDSNKWDDPWFDSLSTTNKLFWFYILDKCDHAGIWKINWKQVVSSIGGKPDMKKFSGRIFKVSDEKMIIPKYLIFQYGTRWKDSNVKASVSAIKILTDLGIIREVERLLNPTLTLTQELPNPTLTLMTTTTTPIMTTVLTTTTARRNGKNGNFSPSAARR